MQNCNQIFEKVLAIWMDLKKLQIKFVHEML